MYVRAFGGSWFDHPFWKANFEIRKPRDLERIRQADIPYVVIDDTLGVAPAPPDDPAQQAPQDCATASAKPGAHNKKKNCQWRPDRDSQRRQNLRQAKALVNRSAKVMRGVLEDARLGRAVKHDTVMTVVEELTTRIERTPRAMLSALRQQAKDEYTYFHSVAVCTLMVNFARHTGRSPDACREYGLAGLLHDIGKACIPDEILNKAGKLTESEFAMVRKHPEQGHALMLDSRDEIPAAALDVCRHHHEKIDGTGYPQGLAGDAIPEIARIGAICDVYDALTSDRAYKDAWTPAQALGEMWSWEGHFDRSLLFTFMQSIASFPPGMLVELRSNRLGLVLENGRRNSRPRVLAFYDMRNRDFIEPAELVIKQNLSGDGITAPAEARHWGLHEHELSDANAVRKLARKQAA